MFLDIFVCISFWVLKNKLLKALGSKFDLQQQQEEKGYPYSILF